MTPLNDTNDPALKSWVASANKVGCDFPIQNLPLGVFRRAGSDEAYRGGVAIGDQILDLSAAVAGGLLSGAAAKACEEPTLNTLMSLGRPAWSDLRAQLSAVLREGGRQETGAACLVPMADAEMTVPAKIGDYTDFYSSINHATNVGKMFRPDNPLLPNYKYVPIAYHGRSSSIRISGTPTKRPMGQLKAPDAEMPVFAACKRLDYETELGVYVGPGTALGTTVPLEKAEDHIFGMCILNDWSSRDIQTWEYQPLGPFLAKNFSSTISPWVVTLEALAPYRQAVYSRPDSDPAPLPHLTSKDHEASGGLDICLDVSVATEAMRENGLAPQIIGTPGFKDMYWTIFQMFTHHTSNGCDFNSGDFYGTGTISGTGADECGSILEVCKGGKAPIDFPGGETRTFLEDGDEVIMRAWCEAEGKPRIGFGDCRSLITPANG